MERSIPEIVRKLVDIGVEKLADGPESLRQLISDVKLPREAILLLATQVDETKKEVTRVLARELREFLERASLAEELTKLVSGLTLEVKTQIRFVPNASPSSRPRPEVETNLRVPVHSEKSAGNPVSVSEVPSPSADPTRQPASSPSSTEGRMAEQERIK